MVAITKNEKQAVLQRYPDVYIARTMKNDSKRHHYYMTEEKAAMRLLKELRGSGDRKEM